MIREWTAERRDTDFNRHINNAAYLVWALDSLPDSWLKNHQLTEFTCISEKKPMREIP